MVIKKHLQLDGKIIAPTSSAAWGSGTLQWLEFTKLKKITIRGKGVIDGQGSVWWNDSPTSTTEVMLESSGRLPSTKPTVRILLASLKFSFLYNTTRIQVLV